MTTVLVAGGTGMLDNEDLDDPFSSPVGGGGAIGKLLGRMLSMVRKLSGGGRPGADSPTHRLNKGARGRNAVLSQARPPTDDSQADERRGTTYRGQSAEGGSELTLAGC